MADNQLQINIGADTRSLEQGLDRATAAVEQFKKKTKQTATATDKAKITLGNLARVASDAPFGFIAIQNNLDPLIDSFGRLTEQTKGKFIPTVKALASSLAGPAGIGLAFAAVSGAVTVAIQKYGSIGNAIDALFGKQTALSKEVVTAAESYKKFNQEIKSTAAITNAAASAEGEISRVKALAGIVSNTTLSYQQRNNALNELEKINKTYFGNLDLESVKLGTLTSAVNAYAQATIQAAVTKGFETEVGNVNVQLREQESLLRKLQDERRKAQAAPQKIVGIAATVDTRDIIAATDAVKAQAKVVTDLRKRRNDLNAAVTESIQAYNNITAPINAAAEAQRKKEEQDRKEAAAAARLTEELKRQAEARKKQLAEILARGSKVQTIDFTSFFDLDQSAARNKYAQIIAPVTSAFEEALKPAQGRLGRDFTIIPPAAIQGAIDDVNKLRDAGLAAGQAFNAVIAPAIDSVFAALESGENVIQSLGQAFKKLVVDLIKATIKAAGLALVISAGSGGTINFGTAFRGALQLGGTGGGFGGLQRAAAPTFGGVGGFGGGLQLAGQVVFTQRGTDLVGVLNSSNARINRVG